MVYSIGPVEVHAPPATAKGSARTSLDQFWPQFLHPWSSINFALIKNIRVKGPIKIEKQAGLSGAKLMLSVTS